MRYHGRHRRGWVSGAQQAEALMTAERESDERSEPTFGPTLSMALRAGAEYALLRALSDKVPAQVPCIHNNNSADSLGDAKCLAVVRTAAGLYRIFGMWAPYHIELWCACWSQREHWHLLDEGYPSLGAAMGKVALYGEHVSRQLTASGAAV